MDDRSENPRLSSGGGARFSASKPATVLSVGVAASLIVGTLVSGLSLVLFALKGTTVRVELHRSRR